MKDSNKMLGPQSDATYTSEHGGNHPRAASSIEVPELSSLEQFPHIEHVDIQNRPSYRVVEMHSIDGEPLEEPFKVIRRCKLVTGAAAMLGLFWFVLKLQLVHRHSALHEQRQHVQDHLAKTLAVSFEADVEAPHDMAQSQATVEAAENRVVPSNDSHQKDNQGLDIDTPEGDNEGVNINTRQGSSSFVVSVEDSHYGPTKRRSRTFDEASRAANKMSWNVVSEKKYPSSKAGRQIPERVDTLPSISQLLDMKSKTMSNSVDRDILQIMSGTQDRTYRLKLMEGEVGNAVLADAVNQWRQTASVPRRDRAGSISEQYFGTSAEVGVLPHAYDGHSGHIRKETMHQSRRLPPWIWLLLSKLLGIRLHTADKPVAGTFMHFMTTAFGVGLIITSTWYKIFDIKSEFTRETALSGTVTIVMYWFWSILGIYANLLARNLFLSPNFLDNVRLHSKTVVKVNTSFILVMLSTTMVALNDWDQAPLMQPEYCANVEIDPAICQVMYVSHVTFSAFTLLWNLIVGITLLSVCRTHTIAIRRFIQELNQDAKAYAQQRASFHVKSGMSDERPDLYDISNDEESYFLDTHSHSAATHSVRSTAASDQYGFPHDQPLDTHHRTPRRRYDPRHQGTNDQQSWMTNSHIEEAAVGPTPPDAEVAQPDAEAQPHGILKHTSAYDSNDGEDVNKDGEHENKDSSGGQNQQDANTHLGPRILSNDEILESYWKIMCRLRSTSLALQRWLMAWIIFILLWAITYIIYWVRHDATIEDLIQFILPILILPIICSAYGEVNYEGRRMIKNICPTPERTYMLFYLTQQPLEMNMFGFAVSYSALVTVLGALGVALCSRLILDEANM